MVLLAAVIGVRIWALVDDGVIVNAVRELPTQAEQVGGEEHDVAPLDDGIVEKQLLVVGEGQSNETVNVIRLAVVVNLELVAGIVLNVEKDRRLTRRSKSSFVPTVSARGPLTITWYGSGLLGSPASFWRLTLRVPLSLTSGEDGSKVAVLFTPSGMRS